MKVMCGHCGSPNLDTDAACYDCCRPLGKPVDAHIKRGKLPEDFPGRAALEAAGVNTYAQARAVAELTDITGIGAATAKKILEALEGEGD